MGRLGDDANKIKPTEIESTTDFSDNETVPFDTELENLPQLPGDEFGLESDGLQYFQDTLPVDEAFLYGDAFETQQVDLGGETQVMDVCDETQVVNLDGDTQVIDDFDAEVLIENDGAGSHETEVLCDTQQLSDDDSARKGGTYFVGLKRTLSTDVGKKSTGGSKSQLGSLNNEGQDSGSSVKGFTSIRVASIRQSGLAARNRGTLSCRDSNKLGNESNQKNGLEENDQQIKELGNENASKVGSSAARKLFMDNMLTEIQEVDDGLENPGSTGDMPQFAFQHGSAGLSYISSQEPGDLSQANALDIVDRFLELNAIESNEDAALKKSVKEKSKPVSIAKGTQNLARKATVRSIDGQSGIFKWDDDLEDEGGGEFFQKKKELFFENGAQRQRPLNSKSSLTSQKIRDKMQMGSNRKLKDSIFSDSKLLSKNRRAVIESSELKMQSFKKNLLDELNEEMNTNGDRLEDAGRGKDLPDNHDVGFDTQMAADAMETLQFVVSMTENVSSNSNEGTEVVRKSSERNEVHEHQSLDKSSEKKRACPSNAKVVARRSKRAKRRGESSRESSLSSLKQSKNVRKQSDAELSKASKRRAKGEFKDLVMNDGENVSTVTKVVGRRKEDGVPVASDLHNGTHITLPSGGKSLNMKPLQKELDSLTPISHRTRSSIKASRSKGENNKNSSHIGDSVDKARTSKHSGAKRDVDNVRFAEGRKVSGNEEASPKDRLNLSAPVNTTPVNRITPISAASPICMGDEYHKQSCRKNLLRSSLMKELNSKKITACPELTSAIKDLRKRRDITGVRAMFSRHLDADIIKQQKKILARLGASVASSMSDATHFITDTFVRTRNMLEAIAFGKPVVTQLWLESCGQANCFIDERTHILRDVKKEKEFGFSMPVSLARACQHPLLQGQRVLITPNTKPGKEILASLVKAVHGLAVERLGRSALKDEKLPDDILILSCEEDYEICVPFLEKGAVIYSSELLLNGIVTQRLEYERHSLFIDSVKRTRSTIWLKKKGHQYLPVSRSR